jgi:hypothetical protein
VVEWLRLQSLSRRLWKLPGLQLPGTSGVRLPLALLQFTQTDAELGGFLSKRGPICGEGFFGVTLVRVVCHCQSILRASVFSRLEEAETPSSAVKPAEGRAGPDRRQGLPECPHRVPEPFKGVTGSVQNARLVWYRDVNKGVIFVFHRAGMGG